MKVDRANYTWRDWARIGAGVVMLVLGLLGLVFPILQGILFLLVAAFLLAPYSRTVRRLLAYGRLRYPGIYQRAREFKNRLHSRSRVR